MTLVEFIYEKNCPNVKSTRAQLLQAFSKLKIKPHWLEWEINDVSAPAYVRHYGSPTILINGKDIDESRDSTNPEQCRLYAHSDNTISGVPPIDNIMNAIQAAAAGHKHKFVFTGFSLNVAAIPAIIFTLLPKLICPFCWPLYTGLLGSIGINFINYTPYLFPLLTLFLILTISGLILAARSKKKYGPVYLGGISSLLILIGKFLFETEMLIYIGLTGLIMSVIWQSRIKPSGNHGSCSACNTDEVVS
jgi:mercuric ion transport protein